MTGQKRNRIDMSYLQRQTLTLVLNRFKTNAEGWRSGESDNGSTVTMAARRELLERNENESKAYGSDFGSQNLPTWQECETAVRSLCS